MKLTKIGIFLAYPLFSIGQIWMFLTTQNESELYKRVNDYTYEWLGAHFLLFISAILMIPCAWWLKNILVDTKGKWAAKIGFVLICMGVFSLLGQYLIDFWLVEIFQQEKEVAYASLEKIQENPFVKFLFYDLVALMLLGHLSTMVGMAQSRKIPTIAILCLLLAIVFLIIGNNIHGIIPRFGYALFALPYILTYKNIE